MNYKDARELMKGFNAIKETYPKLANEIIKKLIVAGWMLEWQIDERRFDVRKLSKEEQNKINML